MKPNIYYSDYKTYHFNHRQTVGCRCSGPFSRRELISADHEDLEVWAQAAMGTCWTKMLEDAFGGPSVSFFPLCRTLRVKVVAYTACLLYETMLYFYYQSCSYGNLFSKRRHTLPYREEEKAGERKRRSRVRGMLTNKKQHSYASVANKKVSEQDTDRGRRGEGHYLKGQQCQMAASTN